MEPPSWFDASQSLHAPAVLDTVPEPFLDGIVRLMASRFDVPVARITVLHGDGGWMTAQVGDQEQSTEWEETVGVVTAASGSPLVVPDARTDPRFQDLPTVRDPDGVRFYAGTPIRAGDGRTIGTLSLLDVRPRQPTPADVADLGRFAALVADAAGHAMARHRRRDPLQRFGDSAPALLTLDLDHRVVSMNSTACALYGVTGDPNRRPLGSVMTTVFRTPADAQAYAEHVAAAQLWAGSVVHVPADGRQLEVDVRISPILDAAGRQTGLLLAVHDTTVQRRAEHLRMQLLDHADETFVLLRPDGTVVSVHNASRPPLERSGDDVRAGQITTLIHPEDRESLERAMHTPAVPGQPHVLRWRQRTASGHSRWMESRIGHLLDAEGRIEHILMASRDIDAQLTMQQHLRLMEAAVQGARTALLIASADGSAEHGPYPVVFVNPAFSELTGYAPEHLLGVVPRFLWEPAGDPATLQRMLMRLERGLAVDETLVIHTRIGTPVWVQITAWPITDRTGHVTHYASAWRDVTAPRLQHQLERDRRAVLELVTRGQPLPDALRALLALVSAQVPALTPSLLFLQDDTLHEAVPSALPDPARAIINGLRIGPEVAACGRAAATGQTVITEDVATDPHWTLVRDVALACHLRACWSVPILSRNRTVLGTFALYSSIPRRPQPRELELLEDTARLTAVILERYQAIDASQRLALYDPLTGLANRTLFAEALRAALEQRPATESVAVGLLDLDRFKTVNDSFGHRAGDDLLRQVALRLQGALGSADLAARMGGDEFTLILPGLSSPEDAHHRARTLLTIFDEPFDVDGRELFMHASLGLAMSPADGRDADDLLRLADMAMYHAKSRHLGWATLDGAGHTSARRHVELDAALHRALDRDELRLHYQPLVDARTGRITEVEALMRWTSREFGPVSPAELIPVAEGSALIVPLGAWVLRQACVDTAHLQALAPGLRVAVNVSPSQFRHPGLVQAVQSALQHAGLNPALLTLEITEGVLMDHGDAVRRVLDLRRLGVRLAIDDFGTGFSSLHYLKNLPVNAVKIDKTFVDQLATHPDGVDAHIVRSVVHLCAGLDLELTAEGVETGAQAELLRTMGCTLLQGWHFSRDLPLETLSERLGGEQRRP
ncbi:EAL domain-containing protein [uncultured Deinococcus sp.]|uniref:EAL domain-containing protein n=1 Tax=uncultured Deinococcus sp. TaxID=158789 RepID=UPI0025FD4472|nr:EAL domain-containing protein [uncultured Deinococcus sp.]